MNTEHLATLRQAASALLATAPAPVVLATLRLLLDGTEIATLPPRPALPRPVPARQAQAHQPSDAWDARRKELRQAMLDRGVGYQELAGEFGVATHTLRHALGRRQAPTQAMRRRLEAWFKRSPALAVAAEAPFRGNGASGIHAELPAG